MKILVLILIILSPRVIFGQSQKDQDYKDYENFVFDSNMPDDLFELYDQDQIRSKLSVNKALNPFYLSGDFDNDGKIDYAMSVVERDTKTKGILIYHTGTKKKFLFGACSALKMKNSEGEVHFPDGYDDYNWLHAWKIHPKNKLIDIGVGEEKELELLGDALLVIKLEAASGLIYWDGAEYRWYQQGD